MLNCVLGSMKLSEEKIIHCKWRSNRRGCTYLMVGTGCILNFYERKSAASIQYFSYPNIWYRCALRREEKLYLGEKEINFYE